MHDVSDLKFTIIPKSDQLNAEQLLGGPMTITITDVRIGSDDQPVVLHYAHDDGRPFKPCKTMRKLLIFAWGEDGRAWPGRSMTLFNDPAVRFGGLDVGGIRISHLSHIKGPIKVQLTATKGKKALHEVRQLQLAPAVDHTPSINAAATPEALKKAFATAYRAAATAAQKEAYTTAYEARKLQLLNPSHRQPAPPAPPSDDVPEVDPFLADMDAAEGGAE